MFVLLRYGNCTTNIHVCTQMINVTKIRPNSAYDNDHQAILELLIDRFPSTPNISVLLSAIAISMQKNVLGIVT